MQARHVKLEQNGGWQPRRTEAYAREQQVARIGQAHRRTGEARSQARRREAAGRNLRTQQAAIVAANKQAEADRQEAQARHAQLEQELAGLQQARADLDGQYAKEQKAAQESGKRIAELEKQLSQSTAEAKQQTENLRTQLTRQPPRTNKPKRSAGKPSAPRSAGAGTGGLAAGPRRTRWPVCQGAEAAGIRSIAESGEAIRARARRRRSSRLKAYAPARHDNRGECRRGDLAGSTGAPRPTGRTGGLTTGSRRTRWSALPRSKRLRANRASATPN